jgi:hypothetical protein
MWAVWIRNCDVVQRNPQQKASVTVKKYLQEENVRASTGDIVKYFGCVNVLNCHICGC